MDEKPKQVQEVVWTGTSDRTFRDEAEVYQPRKVGKGRAVYELGKDESEKPKRVVPPAPAKTATPPAKPASVTPMKPAAPAKPAAAQPAAPAKPAAPKPAAQQPAAPKPAAQQPTAPKPAAPRRPAAPARPAGPAATAREQSRVIAQTVVGSFVDRMKAEAQRKGGHLSLDDIESLDQEFAQKTQALEVLFEKTFQEYARAFSKQSDEERRHHPFDRLMVGAIERVLSGGKGPSVEKGGISRRILPGFFMAVNMMMGPDVMAEYRLKAGTIFDRVNKGGANGPDWNKFTSDPEARTLRLDALVDMAVHFANPDKRAAWFMGLINDHMAPAEADPGTDPDWSLGRPAYERLIDSLFSDLMAAINDPKGREGITKRFGPETCASVGSIMKGLGA